MSKIKSNGKSIIPIYYSKGAKDWNTFDISQKNKMINGWNQISPEEKDVVIAEANRKISLSNTSDNWNEDDWSRLIHIYSDVKLIAVWTKINSVREYLYSFNHFLGKETC